MKIILCQNKVYSLAGSNLPSVKCYRKAVITKRKGTCWEITLCQDCAENESKKLIARAEKKWGIKSQGKK